jgi:transposase InsO family protein
VCKRFKRFPQTIVVDNGAEFHSHYFEQLLATYRCTKKHRPPAKARFGAVVERLFGTANKQIIHELQGNTKITRNVRQVTKSVQPKNLAVWTIGGSLRITL